MEITNDSSAEYDTTTKLEAYQAIPSLRDYVVVSHRERRITVHGRDKRRVWTARAAIAGGSVVIGSLELTKRVDKVYRASGVAAPPNPPSVDGPLQARES